ncbi:hypothetical protein PCASD_25544 [Puccinia coronata f. sp. avenae]|uniref:Uncharacterized protein n=1 Tax=Puccinia coronata f. sp. avenae TaxID=200324 RepID=A0A2N5TJ22_9BASI|nr:hypothetical protein PCASD_25544 [Puccinia coronata f. sp. avenae]
MRSTHSPLQTTIIRKWTLIIRSNCLVGAFSNSKDEVAIGQPKRSGSLSSEASSATPNPMRTVIPASIDLDENAGIFRCPTLRRLIANFGPGIISLNDKRKKLQEELHEKIRAKFHRN